MSSDRISQVIRQFQETAHQFAQLESVPLKVNEEQEISTREIHTIDAIGKGQLNTVSDVARHFSITKSAASQLISKLENKGFLTKQASVKNNKELQLVLTSLGWDACQIHELLHGKVRSVLREQLEQLSAEQLNMFLQVNRLFFEVISQQINSD